MELDVQKNRASTGASFWCVPSFCDRLHPQVQVQVKPSSRCRMVPTDGPEGRPKVSSNAVRAANKHPCNCPCRCAHSPYTCRAGCDADAAAHRASCDAGGSAPTQGTCSEVDSAEQEVNSERATQSRGLDAEALSWPRRSQGASNRTRTAKLGVARRAHPAKPAAAAWDTLAAGQARRSPAP